MAINKKTPENITADFTIQAQQVKEVWSTKSIVALA
jgi:hypothetical protein